MQREREYLEWAGDDKSEDKNRGEDIKVDG